MLLSQDDTSSSINGVKKQWYLKNFYQISIYKKQLQSLPPVANHMKRQNQLKKAMSVIFKDDSDHSLNFLRHNQLIVNKSVSILLARLCWLLHCFDYCESTIEHNQRQQRLLSEGATLTPQKACDIALLAQQAAAIQTKPPRKCRWFLCKQKQKSIIISL